MAQRLSGKKITTKNHSDATPKLTVVFVRKCAPPTTRSEGHEDPTHGIFDIPVFLTRFWQCEARPRIPKRGISEILWFWWGSDETKRGTEAPKHGIFANPQFDDVRKYKLRGSDDTKRCPEAPKRSIFEILSFHPILTIRSEAPKLRSTYSREPLVFTRFWRYEARPLASGAPKAS